MRVSLYEMEIMYAREKTIELHKTKLNAQKSLSKGDQIYTFQAAYQISKKHQKKTNKNLKRAKKALQVTENKLRATFNEQGKKGHKKDLICKKAIL